MKITRVIFVTRGKNSKIKDFTTFLRVDKGPGLEKLVSQIIYNCFKVSNSRGVEIKLIRY